MIKKIDCYRLQLDIRKPRELQQQNKRNNRQFRNLWKLNNLALNEKWAKIKINEEIKNIQELNENKNTIDPSICNPKENSQH